MIEIIKEEMYKNFFNKAKKINGAITFLEEQNINDKNNAPISSTKRIKCYNDDNDDFMKSSVTKQFPNYQSSKFSTQSRYFL